MVCQQDKWIHLRAKDYTVVFITENYSAYVAHLISSLFFILREKFRYVRAINIIVDVVNFNGAVLSQGQLNKYIFTISLTISGDFSEEN